MTYLNDVSELESVPDNTKDLILTFNLEKNKKYKWPTNLEYIEFGDSGVFVPEGIIETLPDSVKEIHMCTNEDFQIRKWPKNLTDVKIENNISITHVINSLPDSIQDLVIGHASVCGQVEKFPSNLKLLCFNPNTEFNGNLDNLPNGNETIKFWSGCSFESLVDNLPSSLLKLNLGDEYNLPVDNLPENLTHLTFGDLGYESMESIFNQPINNLPNNLKIIALGSNFFHPIDNLPDSIQILCLLNPDYNIPINKLPRKLKELWIYNNKTDDIYNHHKIDIDYSYISDSKYDLLPDQNPDFNYLVNYFLKYDKDRNIFVPKKEYAHIKIKFALGWEGCILDWEFDEESEEESNEEYEEESDKNMMFDTDEIAILNSLAYE